jgi:hypothetical protein
MSIRTFPLIEKRILCQVEVLKNLVYCASAQLNRGFSYSDLTISNMVMRIYAYSQAENIRRYTSPYHNMYFIKVGMEKSTSSDLIIFRSIFSLCAEIDIEKIFDKSYVPFSKNKYFSKMFSLSVGLPSKK